MTEPPQGFMKNSTTVTWEEELAARLKVCKLKFNWYLKHRYTLLTVLRFAVVKAGNIRVVWDYKVNGHNITLWLP